MIFRFEKWQIPFWQVQIPFFFRFEKRQIPFFSVFHFNCRVIYGVLAKFTKQDSIVTIKRLWELPCALCCSDRRYFSFIFGLNRVHRHQLGQRHFLQFVSDSAGSGAVRCTAPSRLLLFIDRRTWCRMQAVTDVVGLRGLPACFLIIWTRKTLNFLTFYDINCHFCIDFF